jgi:general secretion pathway protein H
VGPLTHCIADDGARGAPVARHADKACRNADGDPTGHAGRANQRGFTLLELLVVLVIGFVTLNAMPSERQALENEARRIALLFQLARDEAIVRDRPIAFESGSEQYRFLVRDNNAWLALDDAGLLRERRYARAPIVLTIRPAPLGQLDPLRIVFGREPVDKPFLLTLSLGETSVFIRADGIGHFTVE